MITEILRSNVFQSLFSVIALITVVVSYMQMRKARKMIKENNELLLKQKEYDSLSKASKEAIINTVISFNTESEDDLPVVDKYIRTINYGVEKMKLEGFNFRGVDEV